ncbi:hypothetical protein ACHAXN_005186 [Cyclotella atomus]
MKSSLIVTAAAINGCSAFNAFTQLKKILSIPTYDGPPPSRVNTESWLDVLEYDQPPTFDVLAKTIDFATRKSYEERNAFLADDYRCKEYSTGAYPNLETRPFGFTVDPDNPYRCYWFERWEGTNTNSVKIGQIELPPTNEDVKLPTHIMSVHWTPEAKIKYSCLSSPLDRWEGTTKGAGAVFGLLVGAGMGSTSASVGDMALRFQQRLVHAIGGFGRNWSLEEDIPAWWKSKARGADPNDL